MGVTYGFELKGKVEEAQLREAWKLVQKEYPYARTVIRVDVGEVSFVEDAQVLECHICESQGHWLCYLDLAPVLTPACCLSRALLFQNKPAPCNMIVVGITVARNRHRG